MTAESTLSTFVASDGDNVMIQDWPLEPGVPLRGVVIVVHGLGLNITVQSYDTHMDFGLMADAQAMSQVRELAQGIRDAWHELQALAAAAVPRATVRPRASAPTAKRRRS